MTFIYPFSAIVGQEHAKEALLCSLVNDTIGTVLIIGVPGSAKSTLARSLETISRGKKVITIPQNITLDRLIGAIDLETAVNTGTVRVSKGLLEQGHNQILYADNVNLLDRAILGSILAASESGKVVLEREGLSHEATTRFTFIATMSPAEGGLSQGLMDRFDLCVSLEPITDRVMRSDIVKRILQFEKDPDGFARDYEGETSSIMEKIQAARERLPYVSIPEGHQDLMCALCLELGVPGQRGDINLARTARTIAALKGRDNVEFEDVKYAALLAIQHRRQDILPLKPQTPPERETETKNREIQDAPQPSPAGNVPGSKRGTTVEDGEKQPFPGRKALIPSRAEDRFYDIGPTFEVIRYLDEKSRRSPGNEKSGRRTRVTSRGPSGRQRSFRPLGKNRNDIALGATIRAAAPYQRSRERQGQAISIRKTDLHEKIRERKIAHIILFLVDASGSMGVHRRMVAVKGAILSLLTDAYQKRDSVGLMTFRGTGACLLLPPTRSPDIASKLLRKIPTGGTTPLVRGIYEAYRLMAQGRYAVTGDRRSIVLLTDGRGNVPMAAGSPRVELFELADRLAGGDISFIVVDTETGYPRLEQAFVLADRLKAPCIRLEDLNRRRFRGTVDQLLYTKG